MSQHALAPGYLAVAEAAAGAEPGADGLAYSAVADDSAAMYTQEDSDAYADVDEEELHDRHVPRLHHGGARATDPYAVLRGDERHDYFHCRRCGTGDFAGVQYSAVGEFPAQPSQNVVAPPGMSGPAAEGAGAGATRTCPCPAPAPVAAPVPVPVRVPSPAPVPAPMPIPFLPPRHRRRYRPSPTDPGPPLLGPPESPWGGEHDDVAGATAAGRIGATVAAAGGQASGVVTTAAALAVTAADKSGLRMATGAGLGNVEVSKTGGAIRVAPARPRGNSAIPQCTGSAW